LASNASRAPIHRSGSQRVASFINVAECGTRPSNEIRMDRRHVIEWATSRHTLS
jgi:hypothetical protein